MTKPYLTMEDYTLISNIPITAEVIAQANILITSRVGDLFEHEVKGERISLLGRATPKLKKINDVIPLISLDKVIAVSRTPFGENQEEIQPNSILVDENGYIHTYFTYGNTNMYSGLSGIVFNSTPMAILIDYTYGFTRTPSDLLLATAILAQNISKRGTFGNTSLSDEDIKLTFMNDSIFTSDILRIIRKYQGV